MFFYKQIICEAFTKFIRPESKTWLWKIRIKLRFYARSYRLLYDQTRTPWIPSRRRPPSGFSIATRRIGLGFTFLQEEQGVSPDPRTKLCCTIFQIAPITFLTIPSIDPSPLADKVVILSIGAARKWLPFLLYYQSWTVVRSIRSKDPVAVPTGF